MRSSTIAEWDGALRGPPRAPAPGYSGAHIHWPLVEGDVLTLLNAFRARYGRAHSVCCALRPQRVLRAAPHVRKLLSAKHKIGTVSSVKPRRWPSFAWHTLHVSWRERPAARARGSHGGRVQPPREIVRYSA